MYGTYFMVFMAYFSAPSAGYVAVERVTIFFVAVAVRPRTEEMCVTPKRQVRLYMAKMARKRGKGGEKERGRLTSIKVEKLQQLQTSLQRLHDTKSIINICKLCARHIW